MKITITRILKFVAVRNIGKIVVVVNPGHKCLKGVLFKFLTSIPAPRIAVPLSPPGFRLLCLVSDGKLSKSKTAQVNLSVNVQR